MKEGIWGFVVFGTMMMMVVVVVVVVVGIGCDNIS